MWKSLVGISLIVLLVGCSTPTMNKADFREQLQAKVKHMKSYQGVGVMTFHSGTTPLKYDVNVAYQKPNTFRVAMENEVEKVNQVILKNKEGVFIITPSLKKSFRFQTNWPKNQGQVYLYQTIVDAILADKSKAKKDKANWVVDVKTNYPNATLDRQKIWINQTTLAPKKVQIFDQNKQLRIEMTFKTFRFDRKFDKDYFTQKRSLEVYEWTSQIR
jgi:outer membrane lipoprotein-sorting protein